MHFFHEYLPLVVVVSGMRIDAVELRAMSDGFETVFARGTRYAVLFVPLPGMEIPGPQERQELSAWANHPRVVDFTKRLCVGTAAVVHSPLFRVALSAVTAFRPVHARVAAVPSVELGIEHCLARLEAEHVALGKPGGLLQYEILQKVNAVLSRPSRPPPSVPPVR